MIQYNHPRLIVSLCFHPHSKVWRCFTYSLVTQTAAFVPEDLPDSCHSQTPPKQIYSSVCLPYSYPQCEWTMEHSGLVKQGGCRVWSHPTCLLIQIFLLFLIKKGKCFWLRGKKRKNKGWEAATRGHTVCAQPSPPSGLVFFKELWHGDMSFHCSALSAAWKQWPLPAAGCPARLDSNCTSGMSNKVSKVSMAVVPPCSSKRCPPRHFHALV